MSSDDRRGGGPTGRPTVLLDTNALLLPFRSGTDLEGEIERALGPSEILVPSSVLAELEELAERREPHARAALALARRFGVLPTDVRGDRALRELAISTRSWVVTADRRLGEALRAAGLGVLRPRDRARLEAVRGNA